LQLSTKNIPLRGLFFVFRIASKKVKIEILISEELKVLSGRVEWRLPLEHKNTSSRRSFLIQNVIFSHTVPVP
jgi:hypothetical protein